VPTGNVYPYFSDLLFFPFSLNFFAKFKKSGKPKQFVKRRTRTKGKKKHGGKPTTFPTVVVLMFFVFIYDRRYVVLFSRWLPCLKSKETSCRFRMTTEGHAQAGSNDPTVLSCGSKTSKKN
jgi:hypothetical protein